MKVKWQINAFQKMRNGWVRAIHEYSKSPLREDFEGVNTAWQIERCKELIELSRTPTHILPTLCEDEKRALSIAREENCMSMPQLIGFQQFAQEQNGPLPGGYVVVFIMTKVSGRCLGPEWRLLDELMREKIRNSVILAMK
jgi:hypothetical protein